LAAQGQVEQAVATYRQGLAVAEQLAQDEGGEKQRGAIHCDLADVLRVTGDYAGAKKSYKAALEIAKAQGDDRSVAVAEGQLGTLALVQGDLNEAAERHQAALKTFQQLEEPAAEATAWQQLGMVSQEARQWDEAERHYRKSAQIMEERDNLAGAASIWNNLAMVNAGAGRLFAAIAWYEKAINLFRSIGDFGAESKVLTNLAILLQSQQNAAGQFPHLALACQHAEAALAIDQTLDPAAAEIWTTYGILAKIAEKQGQAVAAQGYRQQARQAKAAFAGTPHELRRYRPLIAAVVSAATGDEEMKAQLHPKLEEMTQRGWPENLISAIRHILESERDEDILVDPLDANESMVVMAILQGIADPSSLERFAAEEQP
jgi:tetratricopeptide (TPR) repeat protein